MRTSNKNKEEVSSWHEQTWRDLELSGQT